MGRIKEIGKFLLSHTSHHGLTAFLEAGLAKQFMKLKPRLVKEFFVK